MQDPSKDTMDTIELAKAKLRSRTADLRKEVQKNAVLTQLKENQEKAKVNAKPTNVVTGTPTAVDPELVGDFHDAMQKMQQLTNLQKKLDDADKDPTSVRLTPILTGSTMNAIEIVEELGFSEEEKQDLLNKIYDFPCTLNFDVSPVHVTEMNLATDEVLAKFGGLGTGFEPFLQTLAVTRGFGSTFTASHRNAMENFCVKLCEDTPSASLDAKQ